MASKRRNMFYQNKKQETAEIDAVTRSAFFFIIATLLLFFGEFSCMYGHFDRSRRIFTFVSGVVFIISEVGDYRPQRIGISHCPFRLAAIVGGVEVTIHIKTESLRHNL
ncbi:hypothetical protein AAG570_011992 [Ranatra chinensis]|uniref:Uncharacterized protein n=1 Tax=Ranatra chinensis TaxID=642074 RepID=A0ABD0YHI0_9HEMI